MEVTAYYTSHSPYTLTKINSNWASFNYKGLNGKFLNTETNVTIEISYTTDKNYDIRVGSGDSTKGLLISPAKLLVDNYVLDIEKNNNQTKSFLLSADRIQRVKFIRIN